MPHDDPASVKPEACSRVTVEVVDLSGRQHGNLGTQGRLWSLVVAIRFQKIWGQQCQTTSRIKRHFGVGGALDYLQGGKLVNFAASAEQHAEFVRGLPHSQAVV